MSKKLNDIIKNLLLEYELKPKKEIIYASIPDNLKKDLYRLVIDRNVEEVKEKMKFISKNLVDRFGEKNKDFINFLLKKMVHKMYITKSIKK